MSLIHPYSEKEFEVLVKERLSLFHGMAMHILKNSADADDAVQAALLRGWTRQFALRTPAKLIGWMGRIVINESYNILRRKHGEYLDLVPALAEKVQAILENDAAKILPKKATIFSVADRLADVKGNGRKVYLEIKEDVQQTVPDPASEIALKKTLMALDFQIVKSRKDANFAIICEAVATNAGQYHKFSSAQARMELSVYQENGDKLLAVGARKETLAGATYIIAAKDAITQATIKLAAELLKNLK